MSENYIGDPFELEIEPQELALANLPQDSHRFPAALWFREFLKRVKHYHPSWSKLGEAYLFTTNLSRSVLKLQRENPHLFNYWLEHIKIAFPNLLDIKAVQEENRSAYLQLKYLGERIISSSELSTGMIDILALTILPYLPETPDLIILDEPDIYAHPSVIEIILQSLTSLYDSQVFMSTHSPIVVTHTSLESLIIMRQTKEDGVEAIQAKKHPRLQDWREKIDLGSLFSAGILA
jgi:predicted ATPase